MRLGITIGEAAHSLDDLNREFDDEGGNNEDPRLAVIDTGEAKQSRSRSKPPAPEPELHRSGGVRAQGSAMAGVGSRFGIFRSRVRR